jgi:hypothetical protein
MTTAFILFGLAVLVAAGSIAVAYFCRLDLPTGPRLHDNVLVNRGLAFGGLAVYALLGAAAISLLMAVV